MTKSRIKIISYQESSGRLKEIYDDLIKKRGKLANVHMIQSLRPESIVHHMELYMDIMFRRSDLTRAEREMMAVVVSCFNDCTYCQIHHAEALNHFWKDENKISLLRKDYRLLSLPPGQFQLCEYAQRLTVEPGRAASEDYTIPLKESGWSDSAILDATLVISYFNFVNRIVLALDVQKEEEEEEGESGKGFQYD